MLTRMFFKLLPVQALIVAMGSMNAIVDSVIAARRIGPDAVGVIGLYYIMARVLEALGSVLLGRCTVLCGRSLGSGEVGRTRSVCTLGFFLALVIVAALTLASLLAAGPIADILGADAGLHKGLCDYIHGYGCCCGRRTCCCG